MRPNGAGGERRRRFEVEEDTMGRQSAQKRAGGSGCNVHAAICLKEGGSISNFRSKEGQLKHGEVIIYWRSTRVMKDFPGVREAFTSAALWSACTREARRSFITPLLQPGRARRRRSLASLTSALWRFCRNLEKYLRTCFVCFQDLHEANFL